MIATSIEQSKHLLELGIDPKTADVYYERELNRPKLVVGDYSLHRKGMNDKDYRKHSNPLLSPAWSLTALLEIIRKQDGILDLIFLPSTFDGRGNHLTDVWRVSFDGIEKGTDLYGNTLIEICVQMIEWLVNNGYTGKEDEK